MTQSVRGVDLDQGETTSGAAMLAQVSLWMALR
jgi:hypothetical protein